MLPQIFFFLVGSSVCDFSTARLWAPNSPFCQHLRLSRWGSADAVVKIVHVTDRGHEQLQASPIAHARRKSHCEHLCGAADKHGLDHRAATAAAAASAPTEMSTLLRMIKPRVCRSLCVHERAHLTPSADSRSACEPSANATVLLLVNTDFKSTNCSRCHAAQAGRCGSQHAEYKQSRRSSVTVRSPTGLLLWLFPDFTNWSLLQ